MSFISHASIQLLYNACVIIGLFDISYFTVTLFDWRPFSLIWYQTCYKFLLKSFSVLFCKLQNLVSFFQVYGLTISNKVVTHEPRRPLQPFNPYDWLSCNCSLQYHPWITHKGYENKRNHHQLTLDCYTNSTTDNSMENMHTDLTM